jgi:hypothetical protein
LSRGQQGPLAGCGLSPLLSLIPLPLAAQKKTDLKTYPFSINHVSIMATGTPIK